MSGSSAGAPLGLERIAPAVAAGAPGRSARGSPRDAARPTREGERTRHVGHRTTARPTAQDGRAKDAARPAPLRHGLLATARAAPRGRRRAFAARALAIRGAVGLE